VASSVGAPKWGQSRSQYMPRKGPCRTCLRGASRRPKPKYVQNPIHVCYCKEKVQPFFLKQFAGKPTSRDTLLNKCTCNVSLTTTICFMHSCICIITGVYFRRLKINHESHEFILDPGTVANKGICFKQRRQN
jgi:hypothetical protein